MNETNYLLVDIAATCASIAQRAAEAVQFGLERVELGQNATNETRLWQATDELHASLESLLELRGQGGNTQEGVSAKKARIKQSMRLANALGTLKTVKTVD